MTYTHNLGGRMYTPINAGTLPVYGTGPSYSSEEMALVCAKARFYAAIQREAEALLPKHDYSYDVAELCVLSVTICK